MDKKRKLDYRRKLMKLRNEAERNMRRHASGTAARAYGEGYVNGISEALREFEYYGKTEEAW